MSVVPKGWVRVRLDEIAVIRYGKGLPTKELSKSGYPVFGANGIIGHHSEYHYEEEQLLISCRGANSGVINVSPQKCFVTNNSLVVEIRPELRGTLSFIRASLDVSDRSRIVTGSAQPQVTVANAAPHRILLAPLAEQRRIVAKLDSLFERTRRAREELSQIPRLIEHYKKAILEAAFRGDLTKDWRRENLGSTLSRPTSELPSDWTLCKLQDISDIQSGLALGKKRKEGEALTVVPYLRVANVQRGHLNLKEVKKVFATESEIKRLLLKKGDVLMNEGGDRDKLGRGWIWGEEVSPCIHQNHVFRVRLKIAGFPPKFLSYYANEFGQDYFFSEGKQTTNLASISKNKLSSLPVPIPSAQEAEEIVKKIEKALTWLGIVKRECQQAIHLLDHLDQANLAKAFRGELVPQDPNDEPASVLLERIRAARAAQPKPTRKRRGTSAKAGEAA